jgi:sugar lactone lactonase YvrE
MADARFRAVRWTPPPSARPVPRRSDAPTLPPLRRIPLPGEGPEHLAFSASGEIVAGLADGRIVSVPPDATDAGQARVLADTGGRPLGIERHGDDAFVVCDAERGLLRVAVSPRPRVEVLCDTVGGDRLTFCSNAAVARDGTVYFTQTSQRFGLARYKADLLEHTGTGRVLRYRDGAVDVLADGLNFANGVVVSPDEQSLVVADMGGYRLVRLWLTGPTAGTSETLVGELPGFPDNLTITGDGLIWVGMPSPRDALLEWLLPRPPWLRSLLAATPERLLPGPKDLAWALAVDQSGEIVHDLRGWQVGYRGVTAARQDGERLYLGSLTERAVAVLDLPKPRE